jgi:hypothetical protein
MLFFMLPALQGTSQARVKFDTSAIKLNVTSAIDIFSFPTVQVSYERQVSKYFSISGEFGYQFYNLPIGNLRTDTSFITPGGFKSFLELRYNNAGKEDIIANPNNDFLQNTYLALNVSYRQNQNNLQVYYYDRNPNARVSYTDCYWIRKRVAGFTFIYGMQQTISGQIIFDVYAGVGLIYREVEDYNAHYNPVEHEVFDRNRHNFLEVGSGNLSERNGWRQNATVGCRIGIKLK